MAPLCETNGQDDMMFGDGSRPLRLNIDACIPLLVSVLAREQNLGGIAANHQIDEITGRPQGVQAVSQRAATGIYVSFGAMALQP